MIFCELVFSVTCYLLATGHEAGAGARARAKAGFGEKRKEKGKKEKGKDKKKGKRKCFSHMCLEIEMGEREKK